MEMISIDKPFTADHVRQTLLVPRVLSEQASYYRAMIYIGKKYKVVKSSFHMNLFTLTVTI